MRSKKELQSKEFKTDMTKLCKLLDKEKIKYTLRIHPLVAIEPNVKSIIGYNPFGEWQIVIKKGLFRRFSIIRGFCSFGDYEIMQVKGKGIWSDDPERFKKPEELVSKLKEIL